MLSWSLRSRVQPCRSCSIRALYAVSRRQCSSKLHKTGGADFKKSKAMKKALLIGVAALVFMALRPARATEMYDARCGSKTISVFARHGWMFSEHEKELPERLFRVSQDKNGKRVIYFRER